MFSHERKVTYSEVSGDGHISPAQIADYFQDCSCAQSDALDMGFEKMAEMGCAWILASWQIIIDSYPEYGQQLQVSTWPYDFNAFYGYRNFELKDAGGKRLAVANSLWVMVDTAGGHLMRITPEMKAIYQFDPKAEMDYGSRKIKMLKDFRDLGTFRVPGYFIDTNRHMNNANYIRLAAEYLPEDAVIRQVRVEYVNAAVYGDEILLKTAEDGGCHQILMENTEGKRLAIVEFITAE